MADPGRIDELAGVLDAAIPDAMASAAVPGLAIGLCDASGPLWSAGYGTTRRDGDVPIATDTRFSVQSTSKLATATAVLLAVEAGLLHLDAPIATAVPDFAVHSVFEEDPGARITLRHLLGHTAGFTHETANGSNHDVGDGDFDAHCRSIFATWLRFPVGHHFEYSNLGIDLAGYALRQAVGRPFADAARELLLEPLGMARATFDAAVVAADPGRAVGHWRPFAAAGRELPVAVPMVASGGLYTSVDDALALVAMLLRDGAPLLAAELAAEQRRIVTPHPGQQLGYGLGLYADEWAPGVQVFHHGGSGFGFQAQLFWVPALEVGAVILTNSFDHNLQNELARRIVAALAPDRGPAAPPFPAGGRVDRDDVAGEYVGRNEDRAAVTVVAGGLRIDGAPAAAARYRFLPGRAGAGTYMVDLRNGDVRYRNDAARTPPSTLDPARAGTYTMSSWGVPTAEYELAQDGASPALRRVGSDVALRLAPIGTGLYLSSTGEVLDLRAATPTYANVALD
ncbi:serine hydrolase domain-containing protein [Baekduia alba]|uniref:serine hydrolase domain-containing protein n=1 Tax=Baekduia alba TaxID=2997333 RepID=UPI00233FDE01|nr:serine hydrolase domain-containing protein [Baekduia alba]